MDLYHLVLFTHIVSLLAAISAASLTHFAEIRMCAARTQGAAKEWVTFSGRVGKVFPVALLLLFATGSFMVATQWAWNVGWIDAAIGGVVLLFIGGGFIDSRGKALARAVEGDPTAPVTPGAARLVRDPLRLSVSVGETGLAIGIVFNMVNKPPLAGALVALVLATTIGIVVAMPLWRTGAAMGSPLFETSNGGDAASPPAVSAAPNAADSQ